MVVKEIITNTESLEEHEPEDHANVAIELLEVVFGLFVHFVEVLSALDELDDHLVIDKVEFPRVSAWHFGIVLIN